MVLCDLNSPFCKVRSGKADVAAAATAPTPEGEPTSVAKLCCYVTTGDTARVVPSVLRAPGISADRTRRGKRVKESESESLCTLM